MDKVDVQQRALALTMFSSGFSTRVFRQFITCVKFRWREAEATHLCTSGK